VVTATDPLGYQTHSLTDSVGRLLASIDAEGTLSQVIYDRTGNAVQTIAYAQALTTAQINTLVSAATSSSLDLEAALNTLINDIDTPQDRTAYSLYNEANQFIYTVDALGSLTQFFYDGAGQLTDTIAYADDISTAGLSATSTAADITPPTTNAAVNRHSRVFYDTDGQVQGSLNAEGYLTENRYDQAGQLIQTIAYANATTATAALRASGTFDELLSRVSADPANDQRSHVFYNGKGQVIAILDAENYLTENRYDQNSNITENIRYANTAATYTGRQTLAQLRPAVASNDQLTVTTYSALDQVESVTSRANTTVLTTTQFIYDAIGQLIETTSALGTSEARTSRARYDLQGRLVGELAGEGNAALDALNNPTQAQIDALWADHAITHTYDQASRRTSITDANANTRYFYYNDRNQLSYTVNAMGDVTETTYNTFGEVSYTTAFSHRISTVGLTGGEVTTTLENRLNSARDTSATSTDSSTEFNYTLRGAIRQVIDGEEGLTTRTYNAFGGLESQVTRINATTNVRSDFDYTRLGQLEHTTGDVGGANRSTRQTYDAFGRVTSTTDAKQIDTELQYDRLGRVLQLTQGYGSANAIQTNTTYDAFSRVLTQIDGNRNTVEFIYNDADRSVTISTPEGISTTTITNRHGEVFRIIDGNNITTEFHYDLNGNQTRTLEAVGTSEQRETSGTVDHAGLVRTSTNANGTVTTFEYDAANRLSSRTVAGNTYRYQYDGQGRTVYSSDANGIVTGTQYDKRGQVTATIIDPSSYPAGFARPSGYGPALNLRTEFDYDERGNTLTLTEAVGTAGERTTDYQYDHLGRRSLEIFDAAGLNIRTEYVYDDNDNLLKRTEAAGLPEERITRYQYDEHNRLRFMADTLGQVTQSVYDDNSNVIRQTAFDDTLTSGQIVDIDGGILTIDAAITRNAILDRSTRSVYNDDNRLSHRVSADGHVTQYRSDANGNITRTIQGHDPIAVDQLARLDNGESFTLPSSGQDRVSYAVYNELNRPVYSIDALGHVTGNVYDANGNVLGVSQYEQALTTTQQNSLAAGTLNLDSVFSDSSPNQTSRYVYDSLNRERFRINSLGYVSETRYDQAGYVENTIAYQGNIALSTTMSMAGLSSALAPQANHLDNRVVSFNNDALGRIIRQDDAESHSTFMSYDARGNLTRLTDANNNTGYFFYRSDDKQAYKVDPEGFVTWFDYNAFGEMTDEVRYGDRYTAALTSSTVISTLNTWRDTTPDVGVNQDQWTSSTYTDIGLVAVVTYHTATGNITEDFDYNAFGERTQYTDKNNHVWDYEYNSLGQLVREESPPVAVVTSVSATSHGTSTQRLITEYQYDAFGNQTHLTEAVGIVGQERVTVTHYDDLNRIERIDLPSFSVYNSDTNNSSIQTPSVTREYDAFDNLVKETDVTGASRYFYYDNANRVQWTVNGDRVLHEYSYDAVGNLTLERTYDQRATGTLSTGTPPAATGTYRELSYTFDGNNRSTRISTPIYTHFSPSLAAATGGPNGGYFDAAVVNRMEYDGNGNLIKTTDPRGYSQHHYYDATGNAILSVDELGYVTARGFDGQGNVIRELHLSNALSQAIFETISTASNPASLLSAISLSGDDRITEADYNALGQKVTERILDVTYHSVNASNGALDDHTGTVQTTYTYEGNGQIKTITQPGDGVTQMDYDALGRVSSQWTPTFSHYDGDTEITSQGRTRLYYDALGNPVVQNQKAQNDVDDRITRAIHNTAGFKTAEYDANGHRIDYDLNSRGQQLRARETVTDVNGLDQVYHTHSRYDVLGREASTWQVKNPGAGGEVLHVSQDQRYNAHGQIEAKGYNSQYQETYDYDQLGRVFKTNQATGTPTVYLYDSNGNAVVEMVSIETDLSAIDNIQQVQLLDPRTVQMTLNLYDAKNQLTNVIEPPMAFQSIASSITIDENRETPVIILDPIIEAVQATQGLSLPPFELSGTRTMTTESVYAPAVAAETTERLVDAASNAGISLGNHTLANPTSLDGRPATRTVTVNADGSVSEIFQFINASGNLLDEYRTRITEVAEITQVGIDPVGDSQNLPGALSFDTGSIDVDFDLYVYVEGNDGFADAPVASYYSTLHSAISVPYIEAYGDGPMTVAVRNSYRPGNPYAGVIPVIGAVHETATYENLNWSVGAGTSTAANPLHSIDTNYEPNDYVIDVLKAGELIYSHTATNSSQLPSLISIKGQNNEVAYVDVSVNGGSNQRLYAEAHGGSTEEFILRGMGSSGEGYEYIAYDANGVILNQAQGLLGDNNSHQNVSVVTTTRYLEQRVLELPVAINLSGEDSSTTELGRSNTRVSGSAPSLGTQPLGFYPVPALTIGTIVEAPEDSSSGTIVVTTNASGELEVLSGTGTFTRVDVTRVVTNAATPANPHALEETITSLTTRMTATETVEASSSSEDNDEVYTQSTSDTTQTTLSVAIDTAEEIQTRFHKVVETTVIDNPSRSIGSSSGQVTRVSGQFDVITRFAGWYLVATGGDAPRVETRGYYVDVTVTRNGSSPDVPASLTLRGYGGSSGILGSTNNFQNSYTATVLVSGSSLIDIGDGSQARDSFASEIQVTATIGGVNYSTPRFETMDPDSSNGRIMVHYLDRTTASSLALSDFLEIRDVPSAAVSGQARINGGAWQSLGSKVISNGTSKFIPAIRVSHGNTFEYRLLNSSGNEVGWASGTVGGAHNELYSYDVSVVREHVIDSNRELSFTTASQTTGQIAQNNFVRSAIYNVLTGTPDENIIHRSQAYNAFGEVIIETDGRGHTTDLVYDKLGNVITKISPEVDIWREQDVANGSALQARPTEHFYFNAQGEIIGTQDANSSLVSGAQEAGGFYNTRVLENGRVVKEFFADGSIKDSRYDRLGNLVQFTNQIDLDTRYQYDKAGQLTKLERYNSSDALHSADNFSYDARGNRISHTNALNDTESYQYDAQGRITQHSSFAGRDTNYSYRYLDSITDGILGYERTVGGVEKTTTNARGDTLVDQHNVFNRIRYHSDLGGHEYNYQYNHAGWLTRQTGTTAASGENARANQQIDYDYYHNGYLKNVDDVGNNSYAFFQYDNNGNRVTEYYGQDQFSSGEQTQKPYQILTAEYDALNRVSRAYENDRYDISYEYDAVGNRRHVHSEYYDLLWDQQSTQDFYYRYDSMNRFVVTMGERLADGSISHGNRGYSIAYNAAGERVSAISELLSESGTALYRHEHYQYDPNGALTNFYLDTTADNATGLVLRSSRNNNELGQMENYYEYNADATPVITQQSNYYYDADGLTTHQLTRSGSNINQTSEMSYLADGTLDHSDSYTLVGVDTAPPSIVFVAITDEEGRFIGYSNTATRDLYDATAERVFEQGDTIPLTGRSELYFRDDANYANITHNYAYEGWDSYKQSTITVTGDARGVKRWDTGTSTFSYDSNGHTTQVYDHVDERTQDYISNHTGQILKRYQIDQAEDGTLEDPVIRRFYYLNGVGIGDVGTDEIDSRKDYAQILAERKLDDNNGNESGSAHGDIGERVQVVTSADFDQNYQPIGPDYPNHTPGSYTVRGGDSLQTIALRVWGDASLWYLIADANGLNSDSELSEGLRLTLPNTVTNVHNNADTFRPYDPSITMGDVSPTLPDPVFKKDGCSAFLMFVVIVIVAIVAPYATQAVTASMAGSTFAATYPALAAGIAGGVGAAAGSIAGQFAGIAFGIQDGFDWGAVAVAAVTGGLTQGIGQAAGLSSTSFASGAIKGVVGNVISQQVNMALGRQEEFDWRGVAVAGIAGGINGSVTSSTSANATIQTGGYGGFSRAAAGEAFGNGLRQGLVTDFTDRIVRGSKEYKERGGFNAAGLIGNALGGAINAGMQGAAQDQANRRMDRYTSLDQEARNAQDGLNSAYVYGFDGAGESNTQAAIDHDNARAVSAWDIGGDNAGSGAAAAAAAKGNVAGVRDRVEAERVKDGVNGNPRAFGDVGYPAAGFGLDSGDGLYPLPEGYGYDGLVRAPTDDNGISRNESFFGRINRDEKGDWVLRVGPSSWDGLLNSKKWFGLSRNTDNHVIMSLGEEARSDPSLVSDVGTGEVLTGIIMVTPLGRSSKLIPNGTAVPNSVKPQWVNVSEIRQTQKSISFAKRDELGNVTHNLDDISRGFSDNPLDDRLIVDAVRMRDGLLTSIDNSRPAVLNTTGGGQIQARIRSFDDGLSGSEIDRFTVQRKGEIRVPSTWGEAAEARIWKQGNKFENLYPNGSPLTPKITNAPEGSIWTEFNQYPWNR
jgi:YD repeat-containing protein